MGGAYEFTKCASANLREKDDTWNPTIGGFFAGSILGLRCMWTVALPFPSIHLLTLFPFAVRSIPAVLGYGTALATILGVFDYTGGRLTSPYEEVRGDEVERKEQMRKNRRRPVEETVHQLGEGRGKSWHHVASAWEMLTCLAGVYAPGYAERRVERIKEKYGIDVTNPAPAVHPPTSS